MDTNYLTWKIKIQTCAMQVNSLLSTGDKKTWLPLILNTLTEINQLAATHGPYTWTQFPNPTRSASSAPAVSRATLCERLIPSLMALFGGVPCAEIMRIEL